MRNEVAELKKHLEKFSAEIGNRTEESYQAGANHGTESKAKSVEFIYAQYDELQAFRKYASKEKKKTKLKFNSISDACDRLLKSIDSFEIYSYQFNVKITGLPLLANGSLQSKRQISAYSFLDKWESKKYQSMI